MKYKKPSLTFSQQAQLLLDRGLIVNDKDELIKYLKQVNYYRLSGYLYSFKSNDPKTLIETYKPGTTLEIIQNRYEFDRQLRLILMDAIDRIEITILRTLVVEKNACKFGPFGYVQKANYNPKITSSCHRKILSDILNDEKRSYEEFIKRYRSKYTSEKYLPLWMVVELMSFGQLFTFYQNQHLSVKKSVANEFKIFPPVLDSWLHTINYIRNACAHHVRLWNKPLPIKPKIPDKKHDINWYNPIKINNDRIFVVLCIISYLMNLISPESRWEKKIISLISENPEIPIKNMGFPTNWLETSFWI